MPDIRMPDGQVVRFPDTMSKAQISGLIARKYPREVGAAGASKAPEERRVEGHYAFDGSDVPGYNPETGTVEHRDPYGETYFAQATSGANEGLANILGTPVDIASGVVNRAFGDVAKAAGKEYTPPEAPFGGSEFFRRSMGPAIREETADPSKQFVRRTMESVGASAVPALGAAGKANAAGGILASGFGGGGAAATAEQVSPDNPTAEMIAEMVGSLGTAGATAALKKHAATKVARGAVPTTEKLKEQASKLYDQAEKQGVTASRAQTTALRDSIRKVAADEGIITPTGRVASSFPKVKDALNNFDDYAKGTMSVKQMKATRRLLSAAAQSADGSEARLGSILLKQFDEFVSPMAPQIKAANQLYHRAMKSDTLNTATELAASRAGQFTGSGYENALRTEFRGLERNLIKDNLKGYTPAEQQAISKVAQGTPISNAARNVGRMAPTGPVSFGSTVAAPYAIGHAIGGPALGATLATGAAGTGYAGRGVATRMGINAANDADLLVRSGGVALPSGNVDMDTIRRIIFGSLAAPAANASQ